MKHFGQTFSSAAPPPERPESDLELTVLMPCLNEAETLATCIAKAKQSLEQQGILGEVLIADNGSTDGSIEIAEQAGARVVHVSQRGYGAALMGGIRAARGRFVIMGDADDSYDFSSLEPFVARLREGFDLVMGNRFRGGIRHGAMPWPNRYIGNPVLTGIGRVFFGSSCGDFHCGLRGVRRDSALAMELRTGGMEYASEMVVKSHLLGMRVAEVPTTLSPDGRSRPPHLRRWRDGWRHLRFLLLYSPRWLFLYPGLALMLGALAIGAWLLPAPRSLGGVTLDVHTLLYAAGAILIGLQSVTFSVFSKVFAIREGLLPVDPKLERWLGRITLEHGLLLGGGLIAVGLALSVAAVFNWSATDFGDLEPTRVLRRVIPAVLALLVGSQVVLSSFFLGVLRLHEPTRTP